MTELHKTKFVPLTREEVFTYFVRPRLIEKWSAPGDMSLKITQFEAVEGGKYRYEHTDREGGTFICEGHIKQYVPGKKLVQVDDEVRGPSGKVLYKNLECTIQFKDRDGGTEIDVAHKGFQDERGARECAQGWDDTLEKLAQLLEHGGEVRSFS